MSASWASTFAVLLGAGSLKIAPATLVKSQHAAREGLVARPADGRAMNGRAQPNQRTETAHGFLAELYDDVAEWQPTADWT